MPLHVPSNHATPHLAPSHLPSQHGASQYVPSQKALSKAASVVSKSPSAKEPSQHSPSQHAPSHRAATQYAHSQRAPSAQGSATVGEQGRREPSLHPMSNHPVAPASFPEGGGEYAGSKYATSQAGGGVRNAPSTPSLHPLTQHLQAHPPGSHRSSSRAGRMQSPYEQVPTADDLRHAAVRGRAISPTPSNPHGNPLSLHSAFAHHNNYNNHYHEHGGETPTQSRPQSPDDLDPREQQLVNDLLVHTPRTSFTVTPSALAAEVHNSSFHDEDLCILLHAADDEYTHDVVKRAVRKAIRGRVKKLGLKHENEAVCPIYL